MLACGPSQSCLAAVGVIKRLDMTIAEGEVV